MPESANSSVEVPARKGFDAYMVALLWGAFALNYVDRQVVFSLYPILIRELHFSSTQLGSIGSVFTLVYSLAMPIAGRIADIVRRDRLVGLSLLLWSGATLGTGMARSVPAFLFWRAAMGITESLFMPAALGMIAARHTSGTRSRALSLFATGQFAGIAVGGMFGGWMGEHLGWRNGFLMLAAAGGCYSLAFVFAKGTVSVRHRSIRQAARPLSIFRSRTWLTLCAAFFFYCAMLWITLAWLADFIHERYGLSLTASGFSATFFVQLGSAIGVITGGFLGDRFGQRYTGGRFYVAAFGLFTCAPFAWGLFAAYSLKLAAVFGFAFGALGGLFVANLYASAYEVIREGDYGIAAGVMNLVGGFSAAAAVLLTGIVKDHFTVAWLMRWIATGASGLAITLMMVTKFHFQPDREHAAHEF